MLHEPISPAHSTAITRVGRLATGAAALILASSLTGCGDDSGTAGSGRVEITMTDHAFDVSDSLRPGGTLVVRNRGEQLHMMLMARLKDGAELDELLAALESEDESGALALAEPIGAPGNAIAPGHELEIVAPDLTSGRYALLCFFSAEGDGEPHVAHGMAETLIVEGDAVDLPDPDVSYRMSAGQRIEGPTNLDAGRNLLEITATGEAAALEPSLWRVQEGETLTEVRNRIDQLADAEIPPVGAGLEAGEALVGVVNAPGASGRILLGVDLEPGTYILAGINTDNDGEPAGGTLEQVRLTVS